MKVHKIDHVGIVVNDLAAAQTFFLDFGLELQGEGRVEGEWVDNVVGLHRNTSHEGETAKKAREKQGRRNKSTYNVVGQKAHKGGDK